MNEEEKMRYEPDVTSLRNTGPFGKTIFINQHQNESSIPSLSLIVQDDDFPMDREKLAWNLSRLLNGETSLNSVDNKGHSIFYERLGNAIALRWQKEGEGLTKEGMLVTINENANTPSDIEALLDRMTPDFMKQFCDAIQLDQHKNSPAPSSTEKPAAKP